MEARPSNLEAAALDYAKQMEARYIAKRGGNVPAHASQNVFDWAYASFMTQEDAH